MVLVATSEMADQLEFLPEKRTRKKKKDSQKSLPGIGVSLKDWQREPAFIGIESSTFHVPWYCRNTPVKQLVEANSWMCDTTAGRSARSL